MINCHEFVIDTVLQWWKIWTYTMNMKQSLKHGIESLSVDYLKTDVEVGVERNRLLGLLHLTLLVSDINL